MGAIDSGADNFGFFNPPNVYRPAIIDIRLVGEYDSSDGATNTYRITQNDGKIFEFRVKNGSLSEASEKQIQALDKRISDIESAAKTHITSEEYEDAPDEGGDDPEPADDELDTGGIGYDIEEEEGDYPDITDIINH